MYSQLSVANAIANSATAIILVIVAKLKVTAEQGILATDNVLKLTGELHEKHKKLRKIHRKSTRISRRSFSVTKPTKLVKNQVARTPNRVDEELLCLKVVLR